MCGVNVVCRSAWSLAGSTDVGREIGIKNEKNDSQDVEIGQDALRTPLRSKDCVVVQIAAG